MAAMQEGLEPVNAVMCGTGEYTTGYVHGTQSSSDKKIGVVALTLFELRRLGKVRDLGLVGTTGVKFDGIRNHFETKISNVYNGLNVAVSTFPEDSVQRDVFACGLSSSDLLFSAPCVR
eukprot:Opistho-2@88674